MSGTVSLTRREICGGQEWDSLGHYDNPHPYEDIPGFVDAVYLDEEHFAAVHMIVFEYKGQLLGFESSVDSEGCWSFGYD